MTESCDVLESLYCRGGPINNGRRDRVELLNDSAKPQKLVAMASGTPSPWVDVRLKSSEYLFSSTSTEVRYCIVNMLTR